MTGEKCKELLSSVKFYDNREQLMYDVLLDILNAAFSMGYQKDIDTVCSICEKYGEISRFNRKKIWQTRCNWKNW